MDCFRALASAAIIAAAASTAVAQTHSPGVYRVDAAQSDIHWLIYRAGAMARLGHNHVISAGPVDGRVIVAEDLSESRFEMTFQVAELIVDDPDLRSREGEEFASTPSANDIAGTKSNMLRESLLNAEAYPEVEVVGTNLRGDLDDATIELTIRIAGKTVEVTAPAAVEIGPNTVEASGAFTLTHAELGLTPFSVMMGALQVAEEIGFEYDIRAVREP
jgi:polyisoprenoid-binding protein YceI